MNRYAKLDTNPEFGFISDYIKHDLDDAVNMQVCEGKTFPTSNDVYVSSSMILLYTNSVILSTLPENYTKKRYTSSIFLLSLGCTVTWPPFIIFQASCNRC